MILFLHVIFFSFLFPVPKEPLPETSSSLKCSIWAYHYTTGSVVTYNGISMDSVEITAYPWDTVRIHGGWSNCPFGGTTGSLSNLGGGSVSMPQPLYISYYHQWQVYVYGKISLSPDLYCKIYTSNRNR